MWLTGKRPDAVLISAARGQFTRWERRFGTHDDHRGKEAAATVTIGALKSMQYLSDT